MVDGHTHTHAHVHAERQQCDFFLWYPYDFMLRFAWIEIFPGLYSYLDTHAILVLTTPTYALHMDTSPVMHATRGTFPEEIPAFCLL